MCDIYTTHFLNVFVVILANFNVVVPSKEVFVIRTCVVQYN